MSETQVLDAAGAILAGLLAVVWGMLRANIKTLSDQMKESEREIKRLSNECTRLDEKSKGHDRSYEQLLEAIRDLGRKLDRVLGVRGDE